MKIKAKIFRTSPIFITDKQKKDVDGYIEKRNDLGQYNYYSQRNQSDIQNIQRQDRFGKIAEYVTYNWMSGRGKDILAPDFVVYNSKNKNWNSDLIIDDKIHIGVKSCLLNSKFPISWIFQWSNSSSKNGKDLEVFRKASDDYWIIFVCVNLENDSGRIMATSSAKFLKDHDLFRDPLKKELHGIKKVIYFDDLLRKIKELKNK